MNINYSFRDVRLEKVTTALSVCGIDGVSYSNASGTAQLNTLVASATAAACRSRTCRLRAEAHTCTCMGAALRRRPEFLYHVQAVL